MTHYNGNNFLFFYTRKTKTTVHWILQALGGSLGIAGTIVKMCEKEVHFTTTHGKLGKLLATTLNWIFIKIVPFRLCINDPLCSKHDIWTKCSLLSNTEAPSSAVAKQNLPQLCGYCGVCTSSCCPILWI